MAKDFITYLSDAVGSVTGRETKDKDIQKALDELNAFIAEVNKPETLPERPDLGAAPGLERMSVAEKSDDEIKGLASDSLAGYKNTAISAIEKEIEALNVRLGEEKEHVKLAAGQKSDSLDAAYDSAKRAVDSDVLRRGLARSSIAVNKQAELSGAKAAESTKIGAQLADALSRLDNEIASLSQKRENALADFNIAYAAKLTQEIMNLTEAQEKKKAEALKHNNSLAEKERAAAIEKAEKEAALYGKELDNKQKEKNLGLSADKNDAVYKKMVSLLDALNPVDARELVMKNPLFRDSLSDAYYYKLYDKYTR